MTNLLSSASPHMNGEVNELRVFPDKILDGIFFQEIVCLFFHEQAESGVDIAKLLALPAYIISNNFKSNTRGINFYHWVI